MIHFRNLARRHAVPQQAKTTARVRSKPRRPDNDGAHDAERQSRGNSSGRAQLGYRKQQYFHHHAERVPFHGRPSIRRPRVPHRRNITTSPMTSASIFVRRKQASASSGRHTTGSFSLNEVLSTIGTPV